MIAITKGIVDALVYILDRRISATSARSQEKSAPEQRRRCRSVVRVSRLQMPNLDIAPNLEAWRTLKRLVAR